METARKRQIAILGSTGSIGTQTLDVARAYPGISVKAIAARSNIKLLEEQKSYWKNGWLNIMIKIVILQLS